MKQKQSLIIIIVAIAILLMVFGSKMFYVLSPGERGIVFRSVSGSFEKDNVVGTGLKIIAPWNKLFIYDVKEQKSEETMDVLSKNGLAIKVEITVRYNPVYNRIGYLHETFGTNYVDRLIIPEVRSTVRRVTGRYTAEEIYSTKRNEVEQSIIGETATILKDNNIEMKALLIRSIDLPPDIKKAIEDKLTREQKALAMRYDIEKERLEADRKKIEANGIATYNQILDSSLTEKILKQKGIDATLKLAESPNAKVVVIGSGKDGMPLILGNN